MDAGLFEEKRTFEPKWRTRLVEPKMIERHPNWSAGINYIYSAQRSIDRSFVLFQESNLRNRKQHGEGHDAEQLEADPKLGRGIAPDEFVQDG